MATVFSIVMVCVNRNHRVGKSNIYLFKENASVELGKNT
jgi:hypothetical protein